MKTYYFTGHWEDAWECGDGCCSGGNEWIINFIKVVVDGELLNNYRFPIGTCYSLADGYISVFEQEYGDSAPDCVYAAEEAICIRWLEEDLVLRNVFVNVLLEGKE